ncbi:MAG: glycosyltransferase [Thermoplasmatales archaeon]
MKSKTMILSTGKLNSSLNGYALELSKVSGRERVVILNSRDQLRYSGSFGVREVRGLFGPMIADGWAFNNIFGKYIYRKFAREIGDRPLHYTTFGLPLLRHNDNDIVTIHDLFFLDRDDEAYRKYMNISKLLFNRFRDFRNVITVSNYTKKKLIAYGFSENIDVVYTPPSDEFQHLNEDRETLRKTLGLPLDKKLVLSVSSKLKRKNLSVVQETMKRLGDQYRLVRVGPALGSSITYTDISPEKLNMLYNASDVLLFPTLNEGYGFPVIEAFAAGLPVVASNIEVMREIAGDAAILVEPSVDKCASGIISAIADADVLIKQGVRRSEKFSKRDFANRMNSIYQRVET